MSESKANPARVLLISDSRIVIRSIDQILGDGNRITVHTESTVISGVTTFRSGQYEIVIIDVDGDPSSDWLTAISRLRKIDQHAVIIMISAQSDRRGNSAHADAFARGAADFVSIPRLSDSDTVKKAFNWKLNGSIHALATARRQLGAARPAGAPAKITPTTPSKIETSFTLRPFGKEKPQALAIISSTGGPRALIGVLGALTREINVPLFITQHMPEGFTTAQAQSITKNTDWPCQEGAEGMETLPGHAYLAPGDAHMEICEGKPFPRIRLLDSPPENHCKPSADPMLRNLNKVYGANLLLVVLTGMGSDGLAGARIVCESGGTVVAQDQETSVVWGMPGVVTKAGLCSAVLPVDAIAGEVARLIRAPQ